MIQKMAGSPALVALAGLATAYVLCRIVYLVFFHPLAKYPGPFLAKVTSLYAAYHGWRGDIHLDMWRCHEKYGDVVRYKPNSLLINTAEALREMHSLSSASKYIKSKAYAPMVHRAPNTLTIRGGKDHARRRRIMAQGVSEKAQRGYESRVMDHIRRFCDTAFSPDAAGRPMDMAKWTNYLSFDIMADVVFGAQYRLLGNERFRYVVESIDKSNVRMAALIQAPSLTSFRLDRYLFRDAIKARNRFVKFVQRVVKERLDKSGGGGGGGTAKTISSTSTDPVSELDLFANLAAARDPETGAGFRPDEIAAESATLIVAGSDTSSTAMASVLFYLAHNRSAYEQAKAEVRSVFASRDQIRMGADLAACRYLHACIDESLRLSPPVGSALFREVMVPGGSVIDGHHIPEGVDVGVSIYAIHHNPRCFVDPFVYRPERWLQDDGTGTGSIDRARAAFNPFSLGTRGCLGKGLAQTELMLTMAAILHGGDFRLADGEMGRAGCGSSGGEYGRHRENEFQLYDHVTSQKKGPFLCFTPRSDVC